MNGDGILYGISVWAIPVIFAITFHEAAHGFVAHRLGDDTAWRLGRVTLNPIKHITRLARSFCLHFSYSVDQPSSSATQSQFQ